MARLPKFTILSFCKHFLRKFNKKCQKIDKKLNKIEILAIWQWYVILKNKKLDLIPGFKMTYLALKDVLYLTQY